MSATPRFGSGTGPHKGKILRRTRDVGIAGDVEALQLALAATIGVYDQILATVPPQVRPLVEGAGGKSMKLAREIMEAV